MHLFSAHAIDSKRKKKHDHIIRRVSNHCHFGLKFLFMTTSGAITAWIKHTMHDALYAVMLTFEWQIDTLYAVCEYRCGCGWKKSIFGICHAFFIWTVFSSFVHCRCWHHIAVCNLLFFSSNGAPAEVSWYHVNLMFNIWLMWPMPKPATKKSLDKVIFIIVQMDQMYDAGW